MTAPALPSVRATTIPTRAVAGLVIAVSVLAALFAVSMLIVPPAVAREVWSYPLATAPFVVGQVFVALHHLVLAAGLIAVWRAGLAGTSRLAAVGAVSSAVTMTAFAALEVLAGAAAAEVGPTPFVGLLGALYGALTLLLAATSVLFGIAIVRARVWTGITAWTVLVTGIYLVVPMVPAQFDPLFWGRLALAVWSLLYLGLAVGLLRASPAEGFRDPDA